MGGKAPAVDAFLSRATLWRAEMQALREVLLACGLDEALNCARSAASVDVVRPSRSDLGLRSQR